MRIVTGAEGDLDAWLAMRADLWPEGSLDELHREATRMLREPGRFFVAFAHGDDGLIGFAEASLRSDYVNGCATSPVGFLEGIYVVPAQRGRGIARALIAAVEAWARERGCTEFASDALLDNEDSYRLHLALGFRETERVVYFQKVVTPSS